ncbi:MAG: NAD-dependent epimerase/dehydratase family protein [Acidimicrobiia bacterium]
MHQIAVTGAAGLVGRRLLPALADHPDVERVVGLDVREPERRPKAVTFHRVDIAGTPLRPLLEGVDVLVHLAGVVDPIPDEKLMARVNVGGTRRVLEEAAAVGVKRIVRVANAAVYGAWPDNPLPLTEEAILRPNVRYSPAVQGAEVARILSTWRAEHPDVTVTSLRAAPVVGGAGSERLLARILLGRPPLHVRGAQPPVQVLHLDDLVSALVLAATTDLPGVYNVAADGCLSADEMAALVPGARVPAVPAEALERALARSWDLGMGEIPPGIVPYLQHPVVLDTTKLRAAGWSPKVSNEDAVREAVGALPPRDRRPAIAAGALVGAGVATTVVVRRRRRKKRQS